ncbi:Glycerol-3-phosphate dehydrogenase (NAD(P)(+)) [Pseudopedobacter saltans DSM 12145]|uniref:Glycerol-3-phosphate dehydrogenase [NAD(P)+] n=1 Tax=Pseudopedobacter saltans (strain ATCC 51119 / DSM 12145 / JCM 21818 / CCUG 39354 / LMG 10337 / NBRC 100064 / NCIMB 13643) TaxID=762903 RepID=F0SER8_PSESL|nr:NAD(P)H-dependent glycerol-3-phosphate dehydrogenase [Pseudopedobacter saltans]ADY52984.1 Glycerol-3-phosphate dehydrogenase (NAD(P)(+)) [Pseudopedobacter saltans DSM 12145]
MYEELRKIAVIGGGSWATSIVKMLGDNASEKQIYWWMRNEDAINHIRQFKHNPHYISAVELKIKPENISSDIKSTVNLADIIILNTPAAFLKKSLQGLTAEDFKGKKVVSAIKGIVPEENKIVGDFVHDTYAVPYSDLVVISGPCHAEEVALEKLSYLTIASQNSALANHFSGLLRTRYIKTIISDDIFGTEYAAVLKNIYAVANGIAHGVGYGDNYQAVFISNALREMKNFVDVIHPIERDIKESAYLGDLLVTCYSQFSRNRTFGKMIGKGYTVHSAQLEMNMIAEGYYATSCIYQINKKYEVEMPILNAVYNILYQQQPPMLEMQKLSETLI